MGRGKGKMRRGKGKIGRGKGKGEKGREKGEGESGKREEKKKHTKSSYKCFKKNSEGTLKLTFSGHQNDPLYYQNPKIFFATEKCKI